MFLEFFVYVCAVLMGIALCFLYSVYVVFDIVMPSFLILYILSSLTFLYFSGTYILYSQKLNIKPFWYKLLPQKTKDFFNEKI